MGTQATFELHSIRSGHSPELPMDPVDFAVKQASQSANDGDFVEAVLREEDKQLHAALIRGYRAGMAAGTHHLRSWCASSMIGGAVALFLFAGAFPELASMVIRQQPAPLLPAAQASLNAIPR